jgi:hypothetical protein
MENFTQRNGLTSAQPLFADVMVYLRQFIEPMLRSGKATVQWHPLTGWSAR